MGKSWVHCGMALALGSGMAWASTPAFAQVGSRERNISVTGPRGRSIERSFSSVRGPGSLDRQATISRSGATFQRDFSVSGVRPPVGGPPIGYRGGPGNVFVERNVYVNGGGPSRAGAFGLGAGIGALVGTGAGMLLGSAMASPPPPPPVYVTPAPVVVAPAPPAAVVVNPPVRYQQPPTVVVDPVAMAIERLSSRHENSRIEGVRTLARLGDSRAIPALVDRLKYDKSKDVRVASALAMGEIGDPQAAVYLERVIIYDKKQEVRDAASAALARLPREIATTVATPAPAPSRPPVSRTVPPPSPDPTSGLDPLPDAEPFSSSRRFQPIETRIEESVPPPPTPVRRR